MSRTISVDELSKHNKEGDYWLAIDGLVYDVSSYIEMHPGGEGVMRQLAGHDVTDEFYGLHRTEVLGRYQRLVIGKLETKASKQESERSFASVPYATISAFQGHASPYFSDSHKKFMVAVREFVAKEIMPVAATSDRGDVYPDAELKLKIGMSGMYVVRLGPGPWMKEVGRLGIQIPGGIPPEELDYFHEMIAHQELNRVGLPGFIDSLGTGYNISVPAIWHFGTPAMRQGCGSDLLQGKLSSALAITEPFAGSDVANIRATAELSADGTHYIVNGVKKWITEGAYADYFVTAVRTGGAGMGGISMILVPRCEGLETKQIHTSYSKAAGTALVVYDNVKVPVENILGKKNEGFKLIMYNFNHERWFLVNALLGQARAALADTFMWANQRSVFGKKLIEKDVIRYKLANSVALLESVQSFNENVTYDMISAGGANNKRMAAPIGLLKYQATRACWSIADDCVQILGGRGITKTGMGARVEGFKNYVKFAAVYGGSEEIMADLVVKQALKSYPAEARL